MQRNTSFLLILLSFIFTSTFAATSTADLEYKPKSVEEEFARVNKLEEYLSEHPEATLETIKQTNPALLEGIDLITTTTGANFAPTKEMPLLGGFWWGCCLGIVGLGLVYFITDNDRDEVRKALWGCIITTLIVGIGGLWNPFGWF